ncbi:MAG: glutathione S-transferase family protein [Pseudomonadota bacterium]
MSQPKLTLVTLGAAFGLQNVSPFCLKAEMLMSHLGIDYDIDVEPDPRKAPKGKLPYLVTDGRKLADSELIVEHIDEISGGRVYAGLAPRDRALGVALSRLIDDHLYWIMVASRWLDDDWFPNVVDGFFHIAPAPVRPLVARLARRQVRQTYHLQGLGRHTLAEQAGFARRDLQALQDAVADRAFLCGDEPCLFDFTIASFMAGVYDQSPPTWLTPIANEYPELKAHAERVQARVGVYGRGAADS